MEIPQIVAAGIYDSRAVVKNTQISKLRKTAFFEIELPLDDGGVSYIDDDMAAISTNRIICAKPGQQRHTKFPFRCYYLHVVSHNGIVFDTLMKLPDFIDIPEKEPYQQLFNQLIRNFGALSGEKELLLLSDLFALLHQLSRDGSGGSWQRGSVRNDPAVAAAIGYIKSHLTEELSLQTVAQAASLSPVYFHNLFKNTVGMTLHSYIEQKRLQKAIDLLLTTDHSLTRIAYECGFSSQSYFSYAFKRKMGKTPRQYVRDLYGKYEI